jgi:spore coat polysaccharide biosynthesis protein SpsF
MKRILLIQARTTSTRLPGKVLRELAGAPMLAWQLRRLKQCREVDDVVVATTTNAADDPLVELANREQVRWFRGSEADVLSRFVGAAREAAADVVVRVTSDCPLISPEVTDRVIRDLTDHAATCDYTSNIWERTYPRGLDVEALFFDTLLRCDRLGTSAAAREHVTVVPRSERPELFLLRSVMDTEDHSDLRWTVDTERDFELISRIYEGLGLAERTAPYEEIRSYVRAHPDLVTYNEGIETWTPTPTAPVAVGGGKE